MHSEYLFNSSVDVHREHQGAILELLVLLKVIVKFYF